MPILYCLWCKDTNKRGHYKRKRISFLARAFREIRVEAKKGRGSVCASSPSSWFMWEWNGLFLGIFFVEDVPLVLFGQCIAAIDGALTDGQAGCQHLGGGSVTDFHVWLNVVHVLKKTSVRSPLQGGKYAQCCFPAGGGSEDFV